MARRDRYTDTLHKILSNDAAPPPTEKTRIQIMAEIEAISGSLRGPLMNADRLDLVEQRHLLRRQLAALSSHEGKCK